MEQGDHVVKSPWSNWQFGVNGFSSNWGGTFKGRGDKSEKYSYEGVYERSKNLFERNTSTRPDVMSRYLVAEFCEQVCPVRAW